MKKILYIDNDKNNYYIVDEKLRNSFQLIDTYELKSITNYLCEFKFDAILIDTNIQHICEIELFKFVKESNFYNGCPIFFISNQTNDQKIKEYISLASDHFNHLMSGKEIETRIIKNMSDSLYLSQKLNKNIYLDFETLSISDHNDININLTLIEFKIIKALFDSEETLKKDVLIKKVWGDHLYIGGNNINTHLTNLRKKIKPFGILVKTKKNRGYYIETDA